MKNPFRKSKVVVGAMLAAALFTGCGDSENFVFTNNNLGGAAPVAANDNIQALGNATLNQAAATGVLANDTVNGAAITSFDAVGNNGGALNLNADGSFTYTPVTGFVGAETFAYTLSNVSGSSTATITLTSTGAGRFVDNSGANGTGTQASPFNNLADAVAAAQNGDTIYVGRGDGTNNGMTGGFTLPAGVNLVGEGTGLILAQTIEPAGTAPTIEGPIVCGGDNVIQGVTIDGSAGVLLDINNVANVTVDNCTLANPTSQHIECDDVDGNLTITNNTLQQPPNTDLDYICMDNSGSNFTTTAVITDNTFLNAANNVVDSLCEIETGDNGSLDVTFSRNIANGTVADEFAYGLYWDNEDHTSTATLTCADNEFTNFDDECVYAYDVGGSITGNTMTTVDGAIEAQVVDQTMTISGNVISAPDCGILAEFNTDLSTGTFIIVNNNISNALDDGIYVTNDDDGAGRVAIRDNTVTDSTNESIDICWTSALDICCDITGNTVNTNMGFDNTGGGDLIVEQFGDPMGDVLVTVNTFTAPAMVSVPNTGVVSAADGTCAIP